MRHFRLNQVCSLLISIFVFGGLIFPNNGNSEGWKGIIPLHSTKQDVIARFGIAPDGGAEFYSLEIEGVDVLFTYQRPHTLCGQKNETFDVPVDTVLQITVDTNDDLLLSTLGEDLSQFSVTETDQDFVGTGLGTGLLTRLDHETRGLTIWTVGGLVYGWVFYPFPPDELHFKCGQR